MYEDLKRKIKVLNESIWERRAPWPVVEDWLTNFSGQREDADTEKLHVLYLLGQFMYFGSRETRALLRAMFRDDYRYPIVESIRKQNRDTLNEGLIEKLFHYELQNTRFLGIGNPSESGTHLLYYFRQENALPRDLFINAHQIFAQTADGRRGIRNPSVNRYVFLDDFCGSGKQAQEYSQDIVEDLKRLHPNAFVSYYVLFATTDALSTIRSKTSFDDVKCVYDLDPSFKCFSADSRYFSDEDTDVDKRKAEGICLHYGRALWSSYPLGYRDCQLLIGFHHNTPDNTLPIIWFDEPGSTWRPIFKRYPKVTSW